MASALLIRHGITEWNADQRWQGWTDVPLSGDGERQARAASCQLRALGLRFGRVIASDLGRARRTAELLVPEAEVEIDPEWRERGIGDWAGCTTEQIHEQWPGALDAWRSGELERPPGGELEAAFVTRVAGALTRSVREAAQRNGGGPTLIVSHGGVIRTLERHLGAEGRPIHNLGGRWFAWAAGDVALGDHVDLLAGAPERQITGTAL